jgi:hypothetical protein
MLRRLWLRYPILAACAAAGVAAALIVLAHRFALERSYRTVEISADGDDWATLARRTGVDRDVLYDALRQAGASSVTIYASTLKRLQDAGRITYLTGTDVLNAARAGVPPAPLAAVVRAGRIRPGATYVLGPPDVLARIRAGFAVQLPPHGSGPRLAMVGDRDAVLEIQARGPDIEDTPLGISPDEVALARRHGLAAEARLRNFRELTPDGLATFFTGLRALREPFTLIFDGTQVLGYENLIADAGDEMKAAGFTFGQIESFTARRRQRGDLALAEKMRPAVLRVFSLTPEELAALTPDDARDKYVLAARERNVRVLYVRPFLNTAAGVDELQANLDYVRSIADDLVHAGYRMGKATPLGNVTVPAPWFLLMALGALAATAIALAEALAILGRPVSPRALYLDIAVAMALTAAVAAVHHVTLWSQCLAFLAALAFPTLALLLLLPAPAGEAAGAGPRGAAPGGARLLAESIGRLWRMSAGSALGGILVAGLLSQWAFMLEIRGFLGVKAVHIIPVAVLGLLLVATQGPRGEWWPRLRAWGRQPLLLEYGIIVIAVALAVVFTLGRTGNAGLPVFGGLELKTRTFLQHVVVARPRTKEFLIGHPFMILAFALSALGIRRWLLPAALVGAIGQVGLVNSFSHVHTPLVYILLRTLYALVFGSVIGAALVAALLWARRRWAPAPRAAQPPMPARLVGAGTQPMR